MTVQRSAPVARRSADDPHVESSMLTTSPSFITQSGVPTEEEYEVISSNFGDPRANKSPKDYYAFRLIASGDGLDSYFTRQDVETSFSNFVRDLKKGQAVLGSHMTSTFSYGSSFDAEVSPADESRFEYEPSFYPQWDLPELRTRNWLVGKYFIGRGVTVNGQSSDDLIRSIELGAVRKASISFMVGQYVCGLDGNDLISTMFGPMPSEESCNHFPGISYEGQIAWALMKNNTLVETSLVYKNASPSSMLLRKAETLAARGILSAKEIDQLESRFQVRLPRFEQTLWTNAGTGFTTVTTGTTGNALGTYRVTTNGTEESDMAGKRRGDDATRELVREALTSEPTPDESDEAAEAESEEVVADTSEAAEAVAEDTTSESEEAEATEEAAAAESTDEAAVAEATEEEAAAAEPAEAEATEEEAVAAAEPADATEEAAAGEVEPVEAEVTEEAPTAEVVDVIAEFVGSANVLASALARNPDAFDSASLADAARAERGIDLALIDAGCDTTVGSHVARTFETRSRLLREALGDQLTVEAIRSLQAKAQLGEVLYEELVKDAVAARTGVQGDGFNAAKYRDLLMAARDVAFVKEEIESWKEAKRDRFTPGRSVVPRQPADGRSTKEERKSLPEAPTTLPVKSRGETEVDNILSPRKRS